MAARGDAISSSQPSQKPEAALNTSDPKLRSSWRLCVEATDHPICMLIEFHEDETGEALRTSRVSPKEREENSCTAHRDHQEDSGHQNPPSAYQEWKWERRRLYRF
jgi:hypothetical protein